MKFLVSYIKKCNRIINEIYKDDAFSYGYFKSLNKCKMKLYNTIHGIILEQWDKMYLIEEDWNSFINDDTVLQKATAAIITATQVDKSFIENVLPTIGSKQELWACGVTYYRSMVGRQEESKDAGGADFFVNAGKIHIPGINNLGVKKSIRQITVQRHCFS